VTDFATRTSATTRFESQRFTDFPTIVESIKGGRLDATFMIAPLAMKLREQGVPVKILYLAIATAQRLWCIRTARPNH
jgi:NitT/TauT family transport system substrate-binding protein